MGLNRDAYAYFEPKSEAEYHEILNRNLTTVLAGHSPYDGPGMGHNFESSLAKLLSSYILRDTNGICWQIATLTARSFYDHVFASKVDFSSLAHAPVAFDINVGTDTPTPVHRFDRLHEYSDKEFDSGISINHIDTIRNWLSKLYPNQALLVKVMVNYPNRKKDQLPHWLAVLDYDEESNRFLIGGDLTPFGINDTYLLTVPAEAFQQTIINTYALDPINGWILIFSERNISTNSLDINPPPQLTWDTVDELRAENERLGLNFFNTTQ